MTLETLRDRLQFIASSGNAKAAMLLQLWNKFDRAKPVGEENIPIHVGSILSQRTKQGMVELLVGDQVVQMPLDKAREIRGFLDGAIEAAISDTLMYRFLTEKVGMADETAARALLDFREMRQGSRETVRPM